MAHRTGSLSQINLDSTTIAKGDPAPEFNVITNALQSEDIFLLKC